jgi:hypothetical protein
MKTPGKPDVAKPVPGKPATPGASGPAAPTLTPVARPAPAKGPLTPSPASIETAIGQLRQGHERFRRIRVQVRDGSVTLSGVVYRWEDLHELAHAIGHVPGVTRVILQDIETDSRHR